MKKILDKDLQLYVAQQGGANKILYFGIKTTDSLQFSLYFPPNQYDCTLIPNHNDGLIFKEEIVYFNNENKSKMETQRYR